MCGSSLATKRSDAVVACSVHDFAALVKLNEMGGVSWGAFVESLEVVPCFIFSFL